MINQQLLSECILKVLQSRTASTPEEVSVSAAKEYSIRVLKDLASPKPLVALAMMKVLEEYLKEENYGPIELHYREELGYVVLTYPNQLQQTTDVGLSLQSALESLARKVCQK